MKKIIKLVLLLLITFSFVACSNTSDNENTMTILNDHNFNVTSIINNESKITDILIGKGNRSITFQFKDDKITNNYFTNSEVNDSVYKIDKKPSSEEEKELKKSYNKLLKELGIDNKTIKSFAQYWYAEFNAGKR